MFIDCCFALSSFFGDAALWLLRVADFTAVVDTSTIADSVVAQGVKLSASAPQPSPLHQCRQAVGDNSKM